MLDSAQLERVTRTLALMLRHQPELFDLELDSHGFGDAEEVVRALEERLGVHMTVDELGEALRSTDRVRYELVDGRIRALYGHSIPIEAGPPAKPPERLYVGLSAADADRALRQGLRGGRRRFLHLSATADEAADAARRAGREWAVLTVRSLEGWEEGVNFYDRQSLWLTEHIPGALLEAHAHGDDGRDPRPMDRRDDGRERRERHERHHDRHHDRHEHEHHGDYRGEPHGEQSGAPERDAEAAVAHGDAPAEVLHGDAHARQSGPSEEQRGRRRRGGRGRGRDDGGRHDGGRHEGGHHSGGHQGGGHHGGQRHDGGHRHEGGHRYEGGHRHDGNHPGGAAHGAPGGPRESRGERSYDRPQERPQAPVPAAAPAPAARRESPPAAGGDFGLGIFEGSAPSPARAAAPVEPPRREPPPPPPPRVAPPADDGGGFGAGI